MKLQRLPSNLAAEAVAESTKVPAAQGGTEVDSPLVNEATSSFRNDVQRCERFITALSAHVKACKENSHSEKAAVTTKKLGKVMNALNRKA